MSLFFKNRKQIKNSADININQSNELNATFQTLLNKFIDTINIRFDKLENKIEKVIYEMNQMKADLNGKVANHETRIRAIEIIIEKKTQKRRK